MTPGPDAPYSELSGALAWLLARLRARAAALVRQRVRGEPGSPTDSQKDLASHFITGLFVARVPLLLFQAVQAALLPKLAAPRQRRQARRLPHRHAAPARRRARAVHRPESSAATLDRPAGRPEALREQVGPRQPRHVPADARGDRVHPGADARAGPHRARRPTSRLRSAGSSGIVAFVVAVALGNDLILRNELGFLAGGVAAAVVMAVCLIPRMRRGGATLEDLVAGRRARTARDLSGGGAMSALRAELPEDAAAPSASRARPPRAAEAVGQERARHRGARRGRRARRRPHALFRTAIAFVCFCLAASGTYFLNDALDVEADRRHPTKRRRPIAAGEVSVRDRGHRRRRCSIVAAIALSFAARWQLSLVVGGYLAADRRSTASGSSTKRCSTSRASRRASCCARSRAASRSASPISPWFLIVAGSASLFMVTGKRHAELVELGDGAGGHRLTLAMYSREFLSYVRAVASSVDDPRVLPVGVREVGGGRQPGVVRAVDRAVRARHPALRAAARAGPGRRARRARALRPRPARDGRVWALFFALAVHGS